MIKDSREETCKPGVSPTSVVLQIVPIANAIDGAEISYQGKKAGGAEIRPVKMDRTWHASLGGLMERIGIASEKCADSYPAVTDLSTETHEGKCFSRALCLLLFSDIESYGP